MARVLATSCLQKHLWLDAQFKIVRYTILCTSAPSLQMLQKTTHNCSQHPITPHQQSFNTKPFLDRAGDSQDVHEFMNKDSHKKTLLLLGHQHSPPLPNAMANLRLSSSSVHELMDCALLSACMSLIILQ